MRFVRGRRRSSPMQPSLCQIIPIRSSQRLTSPSPQEDPYTASPGSTSPLRQSRSISCWICPAPPPPWVQKDAARFPVRSHSSKNADTGGAGLLHQLGVPIRTASYPARSGTSVRNAGRTLRLLHHSAVCLGIGRLRKDLQKISTSLCRDPLRKTARIARVGIIDDQYLHAAASISHFSFPGRPVRQ